MFACKSFSVSSVSCFLFFPDKFYDSLLWVVRLTIMGCRIFAVGWGNLCGRGEEYRPSDRFLLSVAVVFGKAGGEGGRGK